MDLKIAATTPLPQAQGKTSSGHDQRKKRLSQDGVVGLVNIGNSCYINAALQALSNSPPFRQYFLECHSGASGQSTSRLSDALASLFQKMWTSDHPSGNLSPRQVSSAMKNQMFRGTQQQDTQEFLRSLLTQVHDETSYVAPPMEPSSNSMTSSASQDSNTLQASNDRPSACTAPVSPHVQPRSLSLSNGKACSTSVAKPALDLSNVYVLDLDLRRVVSVHKMATGPISTTTGAQCVDSLARAKDALPKDIPLEGTNVASAGSMTCGASETTTQSTTPTTQSTMPTTQSTMPLLLPSQEPSLRMANSTVCVSGTAKEVDCSNGPSSIPDCSNGPSSIPDCSNGPSSIPDCSNGPNSISDCSNGPRSMPDCSSSPHFMPDSRYSSHSVPESNSGSHSMPESNSGSHSMPESNSGSHSVPESNSGSHSVPEPNNGSHFVPEYNNGSHSMPESSNGSNSVPESNNGSHSMLESSNGYYSALESNNGSHSMLESSNGSHSVPESNNGSHFVPESSNGSRSVPESNNGSHSMPESSNGSRSVPESNNGSHSMPEPNNGSHSVPESNNGSHSVPESNNGSHSVPESNNGSHSMPESNNGSHSVPESNNGSHSVPESNNGSHSIPESNNGSHSIPESNNGCSSTPEVKSKLSHAQSCHSQDHQHCERRVVRSIVTEMFEGTLMSKVKCFNCKKASITQELFQDLALPIPGRKEMSKFAEKGEHQKEHGTHTNGIGKKVYNAISFVIDLTKDSFVDPHTSLDDCLNAYFDSCELKGDNRYFCSNCDSFQTSVKKMRITRLPEILCVHLKRFRFDTYLSKKIGRHITFPLVGLNLSPYLHKECQGVSSYELMAVITHYGGVSGGHYVAFAKNTLRNQWFEYNDTHVTPVSAGTVASAEGYVLFYRKMCESKPRSQSFDIDFIVPSTSTPMPSFYVSRHWLLLLKHHSDPGPIFCEHVCEHGAILPSRRIEEVSAKVVSVAKETWEELLQRYGGGPALRSLEVCAVCQDRLKCLNEHREKEKNDIYQMQTKAYTMGTPRQEPYLVANSWIQQWQSFIHCKTLDVLPPGAIDNTLLLEDKNGTFVYNGHPYRKLSHEVWSYFVELYGGGPALMTCPPQSCQ